MLSCSRSSWRAISGSRVVTQLAVAVEVVHHADVRLQLGRQVVLLPDAGDPFQIFTGTLGMLAAQLITARACVSR
jgi:hypothetical protein